MFGGESSTRSSRLTGSFVQSEAGVIIANVDFPAGTIDLLSVSGDAILNGHVQVLASSLPPNTQLTFLEVNGTAFGDLRATTRNVFEYVVNKSGDAYSVLATADFTKNGHTLNAQ